MYKNLLLTHRELVLLEQITKKYSMDYPSDEAENVCILLSLLKRSVAECEKSNGR